MELTDGGKMWLNYQGGKTVRELKKDLETKVPVKILIQMLNYIGELNDFEDPLGELLEGYRLGAESTEGAKE